MSGSTIVEMDDQASAGNFFRQIPIILRARKWWVISALLLGIVAAIAATWLLPLRYTSQATMLVEAPQLPEDVLDPADIDLVDRRIARIRQRITSRPDLVSLIQRHNLYPDRRGSDSISEIIEDMRDDIAIVPTVSDTGEYGASKTIAFTLSYTYSEPAPTQAVAQELMERVLQLDSRGNVEQATSTVGFLEERAASLEQQIGLIEGQIAGIKGRNGLSLADGGVVLSNGQGSYDVQIGALQRDNQTLQSQLRAARNQDARDPLVVAAERDLANARSVYSDTHPDVVRAQQRLAEARQLARSDGPNNTDAVNLSRQIEFNNAQIASLQAAKNRDENRLNTQLQAQARAPLVQQQVANLERRLEGFVEQYDEVSKQLTSARTGVRAEDEQMSERLTVVEAPIVPEKPSSPNYLLIIALSLLGGLGLGTALAFAVEFIMRPIRDPETIENILGVAPVGVIPNVSDFRQGSTTTGSVKRRWLRRK